MMDFDNVYGYYENFGTNDDALDRYDVRMRLPRKRKLPSTMAGNGRTANKKRKISFEPTPATVAKLDEKKIFTPGVNLKLLSEKIKRSTFALKIHMMARKSRFFNL